jgi:V8-like Glu-specific endopeptidase
VSIGAVLALSPVGAHGMTAHATSSAPFARTVEPPRQQLARGPVEAAPEAEQPGSSPASSQPCGGLPQVGAIFGSSNGTTSTHFCTGSVVSSSAGDLVITAAHCVYSTSTGGYTSAVAFVPGYHDGRQPYGAWTASKIVVARQWIASADPDYDVAFLVVHRSGSAQRIQDAVGSYDLRIGPPSSATVQAVGYPGATEQPVTCTNTIKPLSGTQLEFDCLDFPDGTSGGPFLSAAAPATGRRSVVGVIGGYQAGGDTPDISYSAYFGPQVEALFSQAEAEG